MSSPSAAYTFGSLFGYVLILALAVGVIGVVVGLIRRSRRAAPVAAIPLGYAPSPVQMSPDGSFWWDGQGWQDASSAVPPFAQRTSDGGYWWDGRNWRPIPPPSPPPVS